MKSSLASSPSGSVDLRLDWRAGRLLLVSAASRRPPAARLLRGLSVAAARERVPRLFSLCSKAQAAVAQAALASAVEQPAEADGDAARREAIQEHLWRLLLDWPQLLRQPSSASVFANWFKRLQTPQGSRDVAELAAFVALLDLAPLHAALLPFERRCTLPALLGLPDADGLRAQFAGADEAFAHLPTMADAVAETGALARHAAAPAVRACFAEGRPLAARLAARGLELAAAVADLAVPAAPVVGQVLGQGNGLAAVWTARGLLVHHVMVEAGHVVDYVVVAPTEWNFHPASAWLAALQDAPAPTRDDAERLVRAWVLALDPCVGTRISFTD
jgi:uptake hydrogenase large subunit